MSPRTSNAAPDERTAASDRRARLSATAFPREGLGPLFAEALRFAGSGFVLLPIGIGVAAFLHEIVGVRQSLATAVATGCMLLMSFVLARSFIFRSTGRVRSELPRFVAVSLSMRVGEYLLFLLLFSLGLNYLLAMMAALGVSFTGKFVLYRTLVFARQPVGAMRH